MCVVEEMNCIQVCAAILSVLETIVHVTFFFGTGRHIYSAELTVAMTS